MTAPDDPAYMWEFRAEDFVYARLDEEKAAAEALPEGPEREAALHRIYCLRLIAGEHSTYVDADGKSWARCVTCSAAHGTPCTTMCRLTRLWHRHPEYQPFWNQSIDDPRYRSSSSMGYVRVAELGGFRKEWEADQKEFLERFTFEVGPGRLHAWKCRACGAMGEPLSYGHARGAATPQHPQCPPDPNGPRAWTIRTPIATKEA